MTDHPVHHVILCEFMNAPLERAELEGDSSEEHLIDCLVVVKKKSSSKTLQE